MGCASSKEPKRSGEASALHSTTAEGHKPATVSKKGEKKVVQPTSNDKARARRPVSHNANEQNFHILCLYISTSE